MTIQRYRQHWNKAHHENKQDRNKTQKTEKIKKNTDSSNKSLTYMVVNGKALPVLIRHPPGNS